MLANVVRYLRSRGVAFRLLSFPAPEPLPVIAPPPVPRGGLRVRTQLILAGGRPAIACVADDEQMDLLRLGRDTGVSILDATPDDLPEPYRGASEPIPPLGGAMGVPVFVDENVAACSMIVFPAFSLNDYFELVYEDFSRIEQPKLASFAFRGELPERGEDEEVTRRVA